MALQELKKAYAAVTGHASAEKGALNDALLKVRALTPLLFASRILDNILFRLVINTNRIQESRQMLKNL